MTDILSYGALGIRFIMYMYILANIGLHWDNNFFRISSQRICPPLTEPQGSDSLRNTLWETMNCQIVRSPSKSEAFMKADRLPGVIRRASYKHVSFVLVCPSVCIPLCLPMSVCHCLLCLCVCLSLFTCVSFLNILLSVWPPICPCIRLFVRLAEHLSICPCVWMFVSPPFFLQSSVGRTAWRHNDRRSPSR